MATCSATVLSDKEILATGIGQMCFIDPEYKIRNFRCSHCLLVAINHFCNTNCQHMICRECLENESGNGCPVCRGSVSSMYHDPVLGKEMLELKVYCANKTEWCSEIVPLHDYYNHKFSCQPPQRALPQHTGNDGSNHGFAKLMDHVITTERSLENLREKLQNETEAKQMLEQRVQDLQDQLRKESFKTFKDGDSQTESANFCDICPIASSVAHEDVA